MILKTVHNYKNTSDKIPKADMREIYDGIIYFSEYNYARYLIKKCKKNIPAYYLNNLNSFISKEYLDKLSDETHRLLAERSRHFSAPVENAPSYSMLISEDDQKMLDEREKMFEDHNETSPNSKILTKDIYLSDIFAEGSYAYETYATKYDTIIKEQKRDIDDGNEQNYSKNAREFIKLMNEALNDDKLTKTEKQALSVIMNAQAPLFWNTKRKDAQETLDKRMLKYYNGTLTKEDFFDKSDDIATEVKDFNSKLNEVTSSSILDYVNLKEDQGKYNTSAVDEWLKANDIKTSIDFNKTKGEDKSKNEYVASDKKDAKKYAGMADEDETKLYKEGGKKISGSKGKTEMVSETTTKISGWEKPAVVSNKDLTKKTETSKGGSVVSITEKIGQTSKISEEVVPPEKESEKLVEETTTVVDETGDTVITDDEYNELKRENLKSYGLINREMTMLGGLAGLSALAIKKRYKDKDTNKKDPEKK